MNTLFVVLLLAGVICFIVAAARPVLHAPLLAVGLALCFAVPLIQHVRGLG